MVGVCPVRVPFLRQLHFVPSYKFHFPSRPTSTMSTLNETPLSPWLLSQVSAIRANSNGWSSLLKTLPTNHAETPDAPFTSVFSQPQGELSFPQPPPPPPQRRSIPPSPLGLSHARLDLTQPPRAFPEPMEIDKDHDDDAMELKMIRIKLWIDNAVTALESGDWRNALRNCNKVWNMFEDLLSESQKTFLALVRAEAYFGKGDCHRSKTCCKVVAKNISMVEEEARFFVQTMLFRRCAELQCKEGKIAAALGCFKLALQAAESWDESCAPFADQLFNEHFILFHKAREAAIYATTLHP